MCRRARALWRRLFGVLLCLLVLAGTALAPANPLPPAVADAARRVMEVDTSQNSYPVNVTSSDMIAKASIAAEHERLHCHHRIDALGLLQAA
jgi:hypothetical protein